jgi:hypothetical protein
MIEHNERNGERNALMSTEEPKTKESDQSKKKRERERNFGRLGFLISSPWRKSVDNLKKKKVLKRRLALSCVISFRFRLCACFFLV